MKHSHSQQNENCSSSSKITGDSSSSNHNNNNLRRHSSATRKFHEVPPVCRLRDILNPHKTSGQSFCSLLDHTIDKSFSDSGQDLTDDVFSSPKFTFNKSLPLEIKTVVNHSLNSDINSNETDQQETANCESISGTQKAHHWSVTENSLSVSPKSETNQTDQSIPLTHSNFSPNFDFLHQLCQSRKRKLNCNEMSVDNTDNDKKVNETILKPLKNKVHFNNLSSTPLSAKSTDQQNSLTGIKKKISKVCTHVIIYFIETKSRLPL